MIFSLSAPGRYYQAQQLKLGSWILNDCWEELACPTDLHINVVASDLGGQATDCDVYIQVLDANEPPTIGHIDGAQGENKSYPFVFSRTRSWRWRCWA